MRSHLLLLSLALIACAKPADLVDADGDGVPAGEDCNDEDAGVYPGVVERCNGVDDDCDGTVDEGVTITFYPDEDGDLRGDDSAPFEACEKPEGAVQQGGDCDDIDSAIHAGATELCDELDNDCDGEVDEDVDGITWYRDSDGDGWGGSVSTVACTEPSGYVARSGDCNDGDADISPDAIETCNEVDDDCDGSIDEGVSYTYWPDGDFDGYGDGTPTTSCDPEAPEGTAARDGDCDDTEAAINPAIPQDACDGADNDCDGDIDEDHKAGWSLISIGDTGEVYEIDPTTATMTHVGQVSNNATSLDVREDGLAVYAVNSDPRVFEVDICDETDSLIGYTNAGRSGGISFAGGGVLYALDQDNETLNEIDLTTGEATEVGSLGISIGNHGMAWDCSNDILYGLDASSQRLFEIDASTGTASSFVGISGARFSVVGLEFDATTGLLWAATGSELFTIDPTTGYATSLGSFSGDATNSNDLALYPACP